MVYVARYTITPEQDCELNYSCYFGDGKTLQDMLDFTAPYAIYEALFALLRQEAVNSREVDYRDYRYEEDYQAESACDDLSAALIEAGWLSEEELAKLRQRAELEAAETHDIVLDPRGGTWRAKHHDGLSCWALDAGTLEEAMAEAVSKHTTGAIEWGGFGWQTQGDVKHVVKVWQSDAGSDAGQLWIFECDDVSHEI